MVKKRFCKDCRKEKLSIWQWLKEAFFVFLILLVPISTSFFTLEAQQNLYPGLPSWFVAVLSFFGLAILFWVYEMYLDTSFTCAECGKEVSRVMKAYSFLHRASIGILVSGMSLLLILFIIFGILMMTRA